MIEYRHGLGTDRTRGLGEAEQGIQVITPMRATLPVVWPQAPPNRPATSVWGPILGVIGCIVFALDVLK